MSEGVWYSAKVAVEWPLHSPVLIRRKLNDGTFHYHIENFFEPDKWRESECRFMQLYQVEKD